MRHSLVVTEFEPLGIDQDQPDLIGCRLIKNRHDHGVDGDALTGAGRAGDQQMWHAGEVRHYDTSVDVFAQSQREL